MPQLELQDSESTAQAPPKRPKAPKMAREPSAVVEGVRAFVEENVPDSWALEERTMFGMAMWMLRGNVSFAGLQRLACHPARRSIARI